MLQHKLIQAVISSVILFLFGITSVSAAPSIELRPATGTNLSGSQSIDIMAATDGQAVTTIQFVADLSGNIPANLNITSTTVAGLQELFANKTGSRVGLSMGVSNAGSTYSNTALVKIGTITFTAPASGSLTITPTSLTKIQKADGSNILTSLPQASTYTFQGGDGPTPTATIVPSNSTLNLKFRLEGVTTSPSHTKNVQFQLKPNTGSGQAIKTENITPTFTADGEAAYTVPNLPSGTYKVCLKANTHLRRCFTGVALTSSQPTNLYTDVDMALKAGDVNNDNKITDADHSLISSAYRQAKTPISDANQKYDIDRDNFITTSDLALTHRNYNNFVVEGDN